MKAKVKHIKSYRSVMDSLCRNKTYNSLSCKFNSVLCTVEKKLPEKDRELINEIIFYRGMLEITIARHLM